MSYFIGEIPIDGYVEFHQNTHNPATGAEADADALPTYRIYEENNDTVISNGNLAKRDDANTLGYYYARVQCTTGAGYEAGKLYFIRVRGVVGAVAGSTVHCFRCVAAGHDAESVADNIDTINTGVAGLNDLSAAQVNAEADQALTDYDAPTKAELDSGLAGLNDPTAATIADAVLDEAVADHVSAGSVGNFLRAILGTSHFNYVVDTVSVDGNNNLLSARVRLFANKTLAGAATKDGAGEGEFASLTITGEYTGGVADFTKFVED